MERKDSTTNIHNIHTQTYTILTTNHNSSHKVGTPSYKPTKLHNTHKKSRVGHKKSHLYIYIYIYIYILIPIEKNSYNHNQSHYDHQHHDAITIIPKKIPKEKKFQRLTTMIIITNQSQKIIESHRKS